MFLCSKKTPGLCCGIKAGSEGANEPVLEDNWERDWLSGGEAVSAAGWISIKKRNFELCG